MGKHTHTHRAHFYQLCKLPIVFHVAATSTATQAMLYLSTHAECGDPSCSGTMQAEWGHTSGPRNNAEH